MAPRTPKTAAEVVEGPTDERSAWLGPDGEPYSIYVLMGRILAELPAIGKTQQNTQQNFMFRGQDDVLNALNPLLSKYGVFVVPQAVERIVSTRTTNKGGVMYETDILYRFTFYGPAGDSVVGSMWGEGTDSGDKSTNKAATGAFKYMLNQVFAISTEESSRADADRHTPEETVEDVVTCSLCNAPVPGAVSSREPMRAHYVDSHGYTRLEDGRVVAPKSGDTPETPATPPQDAPGPSQRPSPPQPPTETPAAATTAPSEPTAGGEAGDEPEDPKVAAERVAREQLAKMGVPALREKAKELGIPSGGKQDELRERIIKWVVDGPQPVTTEPAPAAEPDTTTNSGDGFQCPDCDMFPFDTEEEYEEHWMATHGIDDGNVEEEPADTPIARNAADAPADADTIATVKEMISKLSGQSARAYGRYRKEKGLDRPDNLTAAQASGLIQFLAELAAS